MSRKPHGALVVTGQARRTNYLAGSSIFAAKHNLDVYVSIWAERGTKLRGWWGKPQISRVLGDRIAEAVPSELIGDISLFKSFLPSFFDYIEAHFGSDRVDRLTVNDDRYRRTDIEGKDEFQSKLNHDPGNSVELIFYKIDRAFKMLDPYAGYRWVGRCRPDIDLPIDLVLDNEDCFYTDWIADDPYNLTGPKLVGDNFFMCSKSVFENLLEWWADSMYRRKIYNVHAILGSYVAESGLKLKHVQCAIHEDKWPCNVFMQHLRTKAAGECPDSLANQFLQQVEVD